MSKPADAAPSLRYYRANEGRWRAPFVFAITSPAAFAQRRLSWLDRLRTRLMALVSQWFGPAVIETSVDATSRIGNGEVVHTTRISKWGFLLYEGLEVMVLDPNGKDVAITRSQRMWPSPFFTREEEKSRAEVEPSGRRARYWFPFLGVEMRQTGSIEDGGVRIVQETDFSHVELLLVKT